MCYGPGGSPPGNEDIEDLVHPDEVERRKMAMKAHFESGTPFDEEYRVCGVSGKYIWVHSRGQATWDENGGIATDITERKKA
jgi:PAS domain-containing protein